MRANIRRSIKNTRKNKENLMKNKEKQEKYKPAMRANCGQTAGKLRATKKQDQRLKKPQEK